MSSTLINWRVVIPPISPIFSSLIWGIVLFIFILASYKLFDVDIINSCADEVLDEFKLIKSFSKNQLAILQMWLKKLNSSAAMRCTLSKKI